MQDNCFFFETKVWNKTGLVFFIKVLQMRIKHNGYKWKFELGGEVITEMTVMRNWHKGKYSYLFERVN